MAEKQLAYRYEEITSVSNILPRKAMLARYMLWLCVRMSIRPFVCHKSAFFQNG